MEDPARYVEISVRAGTDRAHGARLRERILSRNRVLFEDSAVECEFERFFLDATDRGR
ncbi:MAG TPA: hypothetical protein VK437_17055 [Steroidobacteraceae bacterium]|nr:hypothetical protein [Steroidobacteraceae bacterium]